MRLVLAIAVLACSAASAGAAEDRYGPSSPPAAAAYAGPLLTWTGKTEPAASVAVARPQPLSDGLYRAATPQAGPPPLRLQTPAPQPVAPAATAALPRSLYDRPATPPAPAVARTPPATPAPVATPPSTPAASPYASGAPRLYSVHRQFGAEPDPIPAPPPGGSWAYRPEASLAGAARASGVGDGVAPEGGRNADPEDPDWAAGQDPQEAPQ